MRIAELSSRSGVSIPTIKYYLREGLLPPGEPTGRNQASYDERHLHRLRLIRALREVGGLSVAAAGQVLSVLSVPAAPVGQIMGHAHRAVMPPPAHDRADPPWQAARAQAQEWLASLGWCVDPDGPAIDLLADVLATLRRLGQDQLLNLLPHYAEAALAVARHEVHAARAHADPAEVMTSVVAGTVFGERLLAAIRLLAHEHVSSTPGCPDRPPHDP